MEEFISKVSSKTGLDETVARQAVGAILAFLKSHSPERFDFQAKVLDKIKGSENLIQEAEEAQEERRKKTSDPPSGEGEESEGGGGGEEKVVEASTATAGDGSGGGALGLVKDTFGLLVFLLRIFGILALLRSILEKIIGEQRVARLIESVEDGAELSTVMRDLGITREQGIKMLRMLVDYLREKVGGDTIDDLVDKVPAVKVLLGESKKEE